MNDRYCPLAVYEVSKPGGDDHGKQYTCHWSCRLYHRVKARCARCACSSALTCGGEPMLTSDKPNRGVAMHQQPRPRTTSQLPYFPLISFQLVSTQEPAARIQAYPCGRFCVDDEKWNLCSVWVARLVALASMVGAAWLLLSRACHWSNQVHHRRSRPKSKRTARSVP